MTLEAAIILPLFLFVFLSLLSVIEMYRLQANISASLWKTGRSLSQYGYLYQNKPTEQPLVDKLASIAFSESYVKGRLEEDLQNSPGATLVLKEGSSGIVLLGSSLMEADSDIINLKAYYVAQPLCRMYAGMSFLMQTEYYGHAWTGYDLSGRSGNNKEETEEYVYVTQTGTVYHTNRNCTYLNPSIRAASADTLAEERNDSGEKYTACPVCKPQQDKQTFYVTRYGEVYHASLNCPVLKRTIFRIRKSEVGDRGLCSKCGGKISHE